MRARSLELRRALEAMAIAGGSPAARSEQRP
jgi:hypothetical protein